MFHGQIFDSIEKQYEEVFMKEALREFFGMGEAGYTRTPEGYFSWQHLVFVSSLMVVMTVLAVLIGRRNKDATEREKNKVLIWAAILINFFQLTVVVRHCINEGTVWAFVDELPLFLCSIQLVTIPMAALAKGRLKEASLDFVSIFGLLGAVMGTYFAGQNYACYPVLSFNNVVSGITHSISGFSALYIMIVGMASMKKKNIPLSYAIVTGFSVVAYVVDIIGDYNYMFLMRGDGTPYDILFNWVGGSPILYPLGVVLLLFIYITVFNRVFVYSRHRVALTREKKKAVKV